MERNLRLRDTSNTYMSTFDVVEFKVTLGVIRCAYLKIACISKPAGRRMKRSEIWGAWILATHVCDTFDLVGLKVILGSFGALFSKRHVSQKQLVVE